MLDWHHVAIAALHYERCSGSFASRLMSKLSCLQCHSRGTLTDPANIPTGSQRDFQAKALQGGGRSAGQATLPNLQLQLVMQQKTFLPQALVNVTANGTRPQLQVRLRFMRSSPLSAMLTAQA